MALFYIGMLASFAAYIYFRIRYTLKAAKNPGDSGPNAVYVLSPYSIATLVVEILCMAAMALYAGILSTPTDSACCEPALKTFCFAPLLHLLPLLASLQGSSSADRECVKRASVKFSGSVVQ